MNKIGILALYCLLLELTFFTADAAIIHGTIYDLSLDKATDAVIEINTEPVQQYVSKSGNYSFTVLPGGYTIIAKQYSGREVISSAEENITVNVEGEFVIDLILFPSFEEEELLLAESDFEIETEVIPVGTSYAWVAVLIACVIAFFLILRMKGKELKIKRERLEKEEALEADELKKVVEFIRKEGGRTTQKEVRKNFPQSEAKISLILTELEDKGRIRKIKKGRGNIIILNK